jgi:copper chaperone
MKKKISIEGMSCGHCVRHVENALKDVSGITDVTVDLKEKNAIVELNDDVTDTALKSAVEEAGYDVTAIVNV